MSLQSDLPQTIRPQGGWQTCQVSSAHKCYILPFRILPPPLLALGNWTSGREAQNHLCRLLAKCSGRPHSAEELKRAALYKSCFPLAGVGVGRRAKRRRTIASVVQERQRPNWRWRSFLSSWPCQGGPIDFVPDGGRRGCARGRCTGGGISGSRRTLTGGSQSADVNLNLVLQRPRKSGPWVYVTSTM